MRIYVICEFFLENSCALVCLLHSALASLRDFLPNVWRKDSLESPGIFFKALLDLFISHMEILIFFLIQTSLMAMLHG